MNSCNSQFKHRGCVRDGVGRVTDTGHQDCVFVLEKKVEAVTIWSTYSHYYSKTPVSLTHEWTQ